MLEKKVSITDDRFEREKKNGFRRQKNELKKRNKNVRDFSFKVKKHK